MTDFVAGKILWSQIRRHARRIDLWIIRGLALLWYVWMLQPAAINVGNVEYVRKLGTFGCGLAFFLSGWLSGDMLETRNNQFLDLLRMTKLGPVQWHLVNLVLAYVKFVWVISVRWPVLITLWIMGKLSLWDLLLLEGSLTILFILTLNVWMFVTFANGASRRTVAIMAAFAPPLFDLMILASGIMANFFRLQAPVPVSLYQAATRSVSVIAHLAHIAPFPGPGGFPLIPLVFYGSLSVFFVLRLQRSFRYGWQVEWPDFDKVPERTHDTAARRTSRLVWTDALAWQASHVHGGGRRTMYLKWITYASFMAFAGLCLSMQMREPAIALLMISSIAASLMAMQKASNCLTQEVKQQTLTGLVLAVGDEKLLLPGWQRGSFWLAIPDLAFAVLASLLISMWSPGIGLMLLGTCWAIFASGPLFMLSTLVPQTVVGFAMGVLIALGIVLIATLAIAISAGMKEPAVFAVTIVIESFFFNLLLRFWALPYWFQKKLSDVS